MLINISIYTYLLAMHREGTNTPTPCAPGIRNSLFPFMACFPLKGEALIQSIHICITAL